MAFILPANDRDFGTQLAKTLSQAGQDIGQGFADRRTDRKDQQIFDSINENSSPIDIVKAHARLSRRGQEASKTLLDTYIKQSGVNQEKALERQAKEQAEQAEIQQEQESVQNLMKNVEDNIKHTGVNIGAATGINRTAIEKRELVDSSGLLLADKAFAKINKGVLGEKKFEAVTSKLAPNSKLSERQNKARLQALKDIYHINPNDSPKQQEAEIDKALKRVEAVSKSGSEQAKQKMVQVLSPKGNLVSIPEDQVESALSNGGKLP